MMENTFLCFCYGKVSGAGAGACGGLTLHIPEFRRVVKLSEDGRSCGGHKGGSTCDKGCCRRDSLAWEMLDMV